jgi:hypoxanthine phosphoribosyltransferase
MSSTAGAGNVKKMLISSSRIKRRVRALARRISKDYAGKELTLVAILKGSVIFFADLIRSLDMHCGVDFMSVSSYKGTSSTGVVRLVTDLREDPVGKNLLLVEDIVDSGYTLDYLRRNLLTRRPATVKICALLDKEAARRVPVHVDYKGFSIPNEFVVGYGLDHNEEYRGLPYIAVLNPPRPAVAANKKKKRKKNT